MKRLCSIITKFIAVIVLIGAAVAYLWPAPMSHISTKWVSPLLVKLLAGAYIPIRFWAMFLSIVEVIILPIALGLLIKRFFPRFSQAVADYLPAFSTIIITVIVMAVVAANSGSLHICGLTVIVVVILHNLLGLMLGLLAGKLLHMSVRQMTAVSIEVGMQNSGLACSLAATHFASMALAPVPGAVFSVWHNISGALAAKVYSHANNLHNNPKP